MRKRAKCCGGHLVATAAFWKASSVMSWTRVMSYKLCRWCIDGAVDLLNYWNIQRYLLCVIQVNCKWHATGFESSCSNLWQHDVCCFDRRQLRPASDNCCCSDVGCNSVQHSASRDKQDRAAMKSSFILNHSRILFLCTFFTSILVANAVWLCADCVLWTRLCDVNLCLC